MFYLLMLRWMTSSIQMNSNNVDFKLNKQVFTWQKSHSVTVEIQTKFPKFKWGVLSEQNSGHTPSEWGSTDSKD